MSDIDSAARFAILAAKQQDAKEVTPDHLLLGCLRAISRFGIAILGQWSLDLEPLGIDWLRPPESPRTKVAYSRESVELLDRAARIAKSAGDARAGVNHLLAAFAAEDNGLMGELKRAHKITSASWRAAIAALPANDIDGSELDYAKSATRSARDYLTPEEAAETLSVHVQTMRSYIRSGRLPAFRLAGERAIRIRLGDLEKVLEPLVGEKKEE
jgi:excisionase family DNA binding protein